MQRNSRRTLTSGLICLLAVATLQPLAQAQTNFMVLKLFGAGLDAIDPNGAQPACSLVQDKAGTLYGTALAGGISNSGTVFRINKDGSGFGTLKMFNGFDGQYPYAGLVLASDGSLFGTTVRGGVSNSGTIFKLNRDGSGFAVLHQFLGGDDGDSPQRDLIEASDGALYGTTPEGSSAVRGTIFRINKDGSGYAKVFSFPRQSTGQSPYCKLLEGSDGALYGTASFGGATLRGVIFKVHKDGSAYTVLYNFLGGTGDGQVPGAGLVKGSDGFLYSVAGDGGSGRSGTIFRIREDGTDYSTIWNFPTNGSVLGSPIAELVEGADGALYGACIVSIRSPAPGGFYKINKDGSGFTILRSLDPNETDGSQPHGALTQAQDGVLYGTLQYGNVNAGGCLFTLSSSPLPPRALSISASSNSNLVLFAASSGIQYDVLRSPDLGYWSLLDTLTSPVAGAISFPDLNPPPRAAFYRLRQH
jgi:uncharacterized repeat protein (TIGR03803 family)